MDHRKKIERFQELAPQCGTFEELVAAMEIPQWEVYHLATKTGLALPPSSGMAKKKNGGRGNAHKVKKSKKRLSGAVKSALDNPVAVERAQRYFEEHHWTALYWEDAVFLFDA